MHRGALLTLPNVISLSRLVLASLFLVGAFLLLFLPETKGTALPE